MPRIKEVSKKKQQEKPLIQECQKGTRANSKLFRWPDMKQFEQQNSPNYRKDIMSSCLTRKLLSKLVSGGEETNMSCRRIAAYVYKYFILKESILCYLSVCCT